MQDPKRRQKPDNTTTTTNTNNVSRLPHSPSLQHPTATVKSVQLRGPYKPTKEASLAQKAKKYAGREPLALPKQPRKPTPQPAASPRVQRSCSSTHSPHNRVSTFSANADNDNACNNNLVEDYGSGLRLLKGSEPSSSSRGRERRNQPANSARMESSSFHNVNNTSNADHTHPPKPQGSSDKVFGELVKQPASQLQPQPQKANPNHPKPAQRSFESSQNPTVLYESAPLPERSAQSQGQKQGRKQRQRSPHRPYPANSNTVDLHHTRSSHREWKNPYRTPATSTSSHSNDSLPEEYRNLPECTCEIQSMLCVPGLVKIFRIVICRCQKLD